MLANAISARSVKCSTLSVTCIPALTRLFSRPHTVRPPGDVWQLQANIAAHVCEQKLELTDDTPPGEVRNHEGSYTRYSLGVKFPRMAAHDLDLLS